MAGIYTPREFFDPFWGLTCGLNHRGGGNHGWHGGDILRARAEGRVHFFMAFRSITTDKRKRIALIALIAHDNLKRDILEWARFNQGTLSRHELYGTGTTGGMIAAELGLPIGR
jgi:hypothetical protein